jgi:hypothetical protein
LRKVNADLGREAENLRRQLAEAQAAPKPSTVDEASRARIRELEATVELIREQRNAADRRIQELHGVLRDVRAQVNEVVS